MISAIILAAGASKRMKQQKLLMRWGNVTVLDQVIAVFSAAGVEDILVVTGSDQSQIEAVVSLASQVHPVRSVFNEHYESGEMLSSIQCGLKDLIDKDSNATLVGLGDQPQIEARTVRLICSAYRESNNLLIVPSYQMRRGHPWLADRKLWQSLLDMNPAQSPRDFLNANSEKIQYVEAETSTILVDLDTPEDYLESHPK